MVIEHILIALYKANCTAVYLLFFTYAYKQSNFLHIQFHIQHNILNLKLVFMGIDPPQVN